MATTQNQPNLTILNDNVLIELKIKVPEDEIVTAGGIVIKQDTKNYNNYEVPAFGKVIQVGNGVDPQLAQQILGKNVALPSGGIHRVPDINNPDMTEEEYLKTSTRYVHTKYENLFLIFN